MLSRDEEDLSKIHSYIATGSKRDLDLRHSTLTSLPPELKKVGGSLYLNNSNITQLNDGMSIRKDLNLFNTRIKTLPNNLRVGEVLNLTKTLWEGDIPNNLQVSIIHVNKTPGEYKYRSEEIIDMIKQNGGDVMSVWGDYTKMTDRSRKIWGSGKREYPTFS